MLIRRRFGSILVGLVLGLVLVPPTSAYNPNQPQGFGTERSYDTAPNLPDQVDLFSGRLSVTIPIGPFTLVYNNNVWRYVDTEENGVPKVWAQPDRLQNAGLGWHLGWGELYEPNHWYNDSIAGQWLYVGADGSRHFFYGALHRNESDGDGDVYYTRDNSYLRLRKIVAGSTWDIEFPDGTTRRFVKGGAGAPYRLTKMWDKFGSANDPDLTITYSADDKLRTVTDRHGRDHYIHLAGGRDLIDGYPLSWMVRVITRVDLQGVTGQRQVYDFGYRNILVDVSCKSTYSQHRRIRLPHLVRIDQPDGTSYDMQQGSTPSYINTCPAGIADAPGSLTQMELPTGGEIEWTYQEYEFPPGTTWGAFNSSAGVSTRKAVSLDGSTLGSWNYVTRDFGGTKSNDPEVWTDVVALPEGDCRRHFFSATHFTIPSQDKGWEYGLPFVRSTSEAGRFLSTEIYPGHDPGSMLCAGTKLRSTYVRYRKDPIPGAATVPSDPACQQSSPCSRLDEWYNTNRTLDAARTVFHDDGNRWADTELSHFDGVGNFRWTVTTGNFWNGSGNDERRAVFTDFTHSPGTFPGGGYVHPSVSDPWLLRLFDRIDSYELDATGETTSRVEVGLDPTTGALECHRILRTGFNRTLKDVVVTYDVDSGGNIINVKHYGGDRNPLPSTTGAGCGTVNSQPVYWDHHDYEFDVLARTYPYQPTGIPGAFLTYDATIDPHSGAVLETRDSAGYETNYEYDFAGRLERVVPENGASVGLTYTNASGSSGARTLISANQGLEIFRLEEQVFDGFGRVVEARRMQPDGSWVSRQTHSNARGWLQWVSEWNAPTKRTQLYDYDAFGRPGRIRPPEGSVHDVFLYYQGVRETTRSTPLQTVLGGTVETYVERTERFDRHGRLREVVEPSGGQGNLTTSYLYDVDSRLTRITSGLGGLQQVRSYDYDNRGFLLSETLPEKGPSGNGTVHYYNYDASGRYHRKLDHNHDLTFVYDFMGRLTLVRDKNESNRMLRRFTYDFGPGFGTGKLRRAEAWNYLTVASTGQQFTVEVDHLFDHAGVGGRIDKKKTTYSTPSGNFTFATNFDYDAFGQTMSVDYPRCVSANCSGDPAGASPNVDFEYGMGKLVQIPGWVDWVSYHPSGLWESINHSNGVSLFLDTDPYRLGRPSRLFTNNVQPSSSNWDSGFMSYDGHGYLKSRGADSYAYDAAGRLDQAEVFGLPPFAYDYDIFGNLTNPKQPFGLPPALTVDPLTNRVNEATYDGAGNVLTWDGQIFSYDPFDRLVNQAWMVYAYDAFGERAASFPVDWQVPTFHLRGLDDELLSSLTYDYSASIFERSRDFVYGVGQVLGSIADGQVRHHVNDHLGTQQLVTNASRQVLASPMVLPYGVDLDQGTTDNRIFAGHERDWSVDTDYMHTRHYYAEMGRFLSVDSHRGVASSPKSLNRYAYAFGNPVNFTDSDGRFPTDIFQQIQDYIFSFGDTVTVTGQDPGSGQPRPVPGPPQRRGGTNGGSDRGSSGGSGGPRIDSLPQPPSDEGGDEPKDPDIEEPELPIYPMTPLIDPTQISEVWGCDPSTENCGPPEMCRMIDVAQTGGCTTMIVDPCQGFDFLLCELPDILDEWGIEVPREIEYEITIEKGPFKFKGKGKVVPCDVVTKACS